MCSGVFPFGRYSVLCEQVPEWLQSEKRLKKYFDRLFPEKVAQATTCMKVSIIADNFSRCKFFLSYTLSCSSVQVSRLDKLVREREKVLSNLERAEACAMYNDKHPKVSIGGRCSCCWGEKVDAIEHYRSELNRLNKSIEYERELVPLVANHLRRQRKQTRKLNTIVSLNMPKNLINGRNYSSTANDFKHPTDLSPLIGCNESNFSFSDDDDEQDILENINQTDINESNISPSSTAFVTFTSLRAKQAAAQCALTPDRTSMRVFHAPDPRSVLWENICFPLSMQDTAKFGMKVVWIVGILFWAIPVSFVNSLANMNSILQSLDIKTVDPSKPWYGFLSGILPVIALALLLEGEFSSMLSFQSIVSCFFFSIDVIVFIEVYLSCHLFMQLFMH